MKSLGVSKVIRKNLGGILPLSSFRGKLNDIVHWATKGKRPEDLRAVAQALRAKATQIDLFLESRTEQ